MEFDEPKPDYERAKKETDFDSVTACSEQNINQWHDMTSWPESTYSDTGCNVTVLKHH